MPITFEVRDRVLRFVTLGDVDYADGLTVLKAGFEAAAASTPAGGLWGLLFDIRNSSENRNSDELRGIASTIYRHRHLLSGRCAVLATDPLHYGLARMFAVFMESLGLQAMVFTKVGDAEAWLDGASGPPGRAAAVRTPV